MFKYNSNLLDFMVKGKGKHLEHKKVKSSIIECILEKKEEVSEPDIRDYLKKKHNVEDQSTINKHMHDLKNRECIELIPPEKKGLRNKWDIKNIKNLKNIRHEFPELRLNKYEKSIDLIMHHFGRSLMDPNGLKLYIQLLLSPSLFNMCIDTDEKTLFEGVWRIYINCKGADRYQRIESLLKVCYSACVKHYSSFQISENAFIDIRNNSLFTYLWLFDGKTILEIFEKFLPGLPEEIPKLVFKTGLSGIEGIPKEIPDEINGEELTKYMLNTIRLVTEQFQDFESTRDGILLEHCLKNDMLLGPVLQEEINFVKKTKDALLLANVWGSQKIKKADLKLASEIVFNYKQPSRFIEGANDPDDVFKKLLRFYGALVVDE
jgi:hypothetical protein